MANIIIQSNQFKFPTKEERHEIDKIIPQLPCFSFKHKSELESILKEKKTLMEASKYSNLFWWNNCLQNRLGKLRETYIYTLTNYNRGFSADDYMITKNEQQIVNGLQFDYFAEIFYYYFFSTRDIIAQILRLYFSLNIEEDKLYFNNNLIDKIENEEVKTLVTTFFQKSKNASDYRNASAHRFTPTLKDYRSTVYEENGKECLKVGGGKTISSKEIIENINNSINSLSVLLKGLDNNMNEIN